MTDFYEPPSARLTPERVAKGNLQYSLYANGSIRSAQIVSHSILSLLVERNRLDQSAVTTARTFFDWRDAHNAQVEGRIYVHEGQGQPGEYTKADRYKLLLRVVPKAQTDTMLLACDPHPGSVPLGRALTDPSDFQTAFEWVDRCILDILKDYQAVFERLKVERP